jgi:uncharacterized SAM-binding protein YcdF (DUF218 family)
MLGKKQEQFQLGVPRKKSKIRQGATVLVLLLVGAAAIPHLLARGEGHSTGKAADAILVLTGGENRIAEGFRAWNEGKGKELFILGAGREATLSSILPAGMEISPAELLRIHIEGWSQNTLENAFSAKSAVVSRGYREVILVTSDYHVPRAYLAMRKILPPDVSISVSPVVSNWRRKGAWYRLPRLFLVEGWKYWGYLFFLRWE